MPDAPTGGPTMAMRISEGVRALMRPSAAALEPYDPAFSPVEVNLSANENTHGMPAAVRAAVDEALSRVATNRYPTPLSDELRLELARLHGVAPDQVAIGNGGDELLFNLFLAFGGPGHMLVNCPPTFSVYRLYAELVETEVVDVPRDPGTFEPDLGALVEAARTAHLVVVTSPNNPTGGLFPRDGVGRLCEACPGIVLVDEAYIEFSGPSSSCEPLLSAYPNLAVLHTFSKAFCLAAGRLGYILASRSVVAALSAVRQPYSVSSFDQAAALAALRHRNAFVAAIDAIRAERARVLAALTALGGVTVWPSEANFLLVRVADAHRVWERLRDERSILVRDVSRGAGTEGCLRITVGTPEENDRVVSALAALL